MARAGLHSYHPSRALLWLSCAMAACTGGIRRPPGSAVATRPPVVVTIVFAAVDAWLACAQRQSPARCLQASEATPGGQIALLAVETFGTRTKPSVAPSRDAVATLVHGMKAWKAADLWADAASYLPRTVSGTIRVFVVGNGHPLGDGYVRRVRFQGPQATLAPDGEPVIILNALLLARVPAQALLGGMKHEIFHVLSEWYRRADPAWRRAPLRPTPDQELLLLVLEEGIAHFVDRGPRLMREGFPPGEAKKALAQLADAVRQLRPSSNRTPAAKALLSAATTGTYWDKYGSISGMFVAYGVYRAFGVEGLRESMRCGPARLFQLYDAAMASVPGLVALPPEVSGWSGGISLCAPKPLLPPRASGK